MTPVANIPSFEEYAQDVMELRYSHTVNNRKETWEGISKRVVDAIVGRKVSKDIKRDILQAIVERKFIPGGRQLSQAGRRYHQTDNCFMLHAEDTREGWAELAKKATMMFMSGGGVGVCYDDIRPYGTVLKRSGGIASGPIPLVQMVNAIGAAARQGGERRGAIYGSLKWDHDDVYEFIKMKEGDGELQHTNISVRFDERWHRDEAGNAHATDVYYQTLKNACKYGDPGFQFDSDNQILRNACTEVISADDSDSCCLGSVNFSKINNKQELSVVSQLGVIFLLCATMYTDMPTAKVKQVKRKNRRLGLGFMGLGEWFLQRGLRYGRSYQLEGWLEVWKKDSTYAASEWAKKLNIATPIAVRAVAPTGTISIAGGHTTPGIEPVFHTAYERCYNTLKTRDNKDGFVRQRVIDPVVSKWIQEGYDVRDIDTAWSLSQSIEGIERRIGLQAMVQRYTDNAISSTINLPQYVDGVEDKIAPVLLKYLYQLRGITFYPDGRHKNQPVIPIDINDVLKDNNVEMQEHESCKGGVCGI